MHLENVASHLGQDDLETDDEDPDGDEHEVIADSRENVEFIMDLPGGEHVSDLEEHEQGEEEGELAGVSGRVVVDHVSDQISADTINSIHVLRVFAGILGLVRDAISSN